MLLIAAAIAASTAQPSPPKQYAGVTVQARVSIRVISGTVLHFESAKSDDGRTVRDGVIRTNAGSEPAKLIEFE